MDDLRQHKKEVLRMRPERATRAVDNAARCLQGPTIATMTHLQKILDTTHLECKPQIAAVGSLTGRSRPSAACLMRPTDA
jgi:hypothetical protein